MRGILIVVSVCGVLALGPGAVAGPLTTGPLVQVSGPSPFADCPPAAADAFLPIAGEVEPYVAVNPTDAANAVGVWFQDRLRGLVAGVSFDGGASWRQVVVPGLTRCTGGAFDYANDPWVSFAPNGDLYLSAHVFNAALVPNGVAVTKSGVLASKSTDGGSTWSDPLPLVVETDPTVGVHDKESLTADPTDQDLVYGVWTRFQQPADETAGRVQSFRGPVLFARSTDAGHTWERAHKIFDPGPNHATTGNQVVVLPNGRLVDGFSLAGVGATQQGQWSAVVIRSTNKGRSWSAATTVDTIQSVGTTDPQTGDPVDRGGNVLTDLAVDPASGRLYLVWQDARFNAGQADGIALSSSGDGGRTWTKAVKVNTTPTDIPVGNQQAFTPSVEVSADGTVAVSYFDFRHNDLAEPLLTDRWLVHCHPTAKAACTTSQGFGGEVRLTDASFDLRQAAQLPGVLGPTGFFLGDYMGLAHAGQDFLAMFSQPHDSDQASVFARRVSP